MSFSSDGSFLLNIYRYLSLILLILDEARETRIKIIPKITSAGVVLPPLLFPLDRVGD